MEIIQACIDKKEKRIRNYIRNTKMQIGYLKSVENPEFIGEVSLENTKYGESIDVLVSYKGNIIYFDSPNHGVFKDKVQVIFGFKNKKLVTFVPFKGSLKEGENYYYIENKYLFEREIELLKSISKENSRKQ